MHSYTTRAGKNPWKRTYKAAAAAATLGTAGSAGARFEAGHTYIGVAPPVLPYHVAPQGCWRDDVTAGS
ncbi:hypothetical protein WJX79_004661 [Trebouxia sp. C0005]